jgi:tetratricopeptide (TPR) repeat protein
MRIELNKMARRLYKGSIIVHGLLWTFFATAAETADVKTADKYFKAARYALALKEYQACEKAKVGDAGYLFLREAVCAEKLKDSCVREKALSRLRNLELDSDNSRYVEAAYKIQYDELQFERSSVTVMEGYLNELLKKFKGNNFASRTATHEVKKRIISGDYSGAVKLFKNCRAGYSQSLTNAIGVVVAFLKNKAVKNDYMPAFMILAREDVTLALALAENESSRDGGWMLWGGIGDVLLRCGKSEKALQSFRRAQKCAGAPIVELDGKILSLELSLPSHRKRAIPRALEYLAKNHDAKKHYSVFEMTFKALLKDGRFDEAEALFFSQKVAPERYRTESLITELREAKKKYETKNKKRSCHTMAHKKKSLISSILKFQKAGKYREALKICDSVLQSSSDEEECQRALRLSADICYEELHDFEEAARRYKVVVDGEGKGLLFTPRMCRFLLCLIIIGREQEARERMAKTGLISEIVSSALEVGNKSEKVIKRDTPAYFLRAANILFTAEEFKLALKIYGRIELKKGVAREIENEVMMQRARCMSRLGQAEKALSVYKRLLLRVGRSPLASDALMRMAVIYAGHLGDNVNAMSCYERVELEYSKTENAQQAMFYRLMLLMLSKEWDAASKLRAKFLRTYKPGRDYDIVNACGEAIEKRKFP